MRTFDILLENPVPLSELRRHIADIPTYRTLYEWCRTGVQVKAGPRKGTLVTMDFYHRGGEIVTSVEAYFRFQRAVNGDDQKDAQDDPRQKGVRKGP